MSIRRENSAPTVSRGRTARHVHALMAALALASCGTTKPSSADSVVPRDVLDEIASMAPDRAPHEDVHDARPEASLPRTALAVDADLQAIFNPNLSLYLFDCGQADSLLVVGPGEDAKTLLMDLGEPRSGPKNYEHIAQSLLDITGESHIDYLVVSHFHSDHTGSWNSGIAGLLDLIVPQFTVGSFIDLGELGSEFITGARSTKAILEENLERWLDTGIVGERRRPWFGDPIVLGTLDGQQATVEFLTFGGMAFEGDPGRFATVAALYPGLYDRATGSENDISIGLQVDFGEFEFFTAGDLTGWNPSDWEGRNVPIPPLFTPRRFGSKRQTYTNVESHLVDVWANGPAQREADVEVYRANHHGSRYSSAPDFLEALDPEFVIYSAGRDNTYNHPEPSVVNRVAGGAHQIVTDGTASGAWAVFQDADGQILETIVIQVAADGLSYRITGTREHPQPDHPVFREQPAYTDAQERAGEDVAP